MINSLSNIVSGADDLFCTFYDNDSNKKIGRKATAVLTAGAWQHVVCTWDGSTSSSGIKIYRNGTQVDDTDNNAGSFTGVPTGAEFTIGAQKSGASGNTGFNGKVDEVYFWDRDLSKKIFNIVIFLVHTSHQSGRTLDTFWCIP